MTESFYKKDLGLHWETIKFYSQETEFCVEFIDAVIGTPKVTELKDNSHDL